MSRESVIALMRQTGQPVILSGVAVRKNRARDPGRLQVFVAPSASDKPTAYRAEVAGKRVDVRSVLSLLADQRIITRRGWRVRTRCYLPQS